MRVFQAAFSSQTERTQLLDSLSWFLWARNVYDVRACEKVKAPPLFNVCQHDAHKKIDQTIPIVNWREACLRCSLKLVSWPRLKPCLSDPSALIIVLPAVFKAIPSALRIHTHTKGQSFDHTIPTTILTLPADASNMSWDLSILH